MFLSDFSIKRPVATVVIIIALMCFGLLALKNLRVNQIPDVDQPVMVVVLMQRWFVNGLVETEK